MKKCPVCKKIKTKNEFNKNTEKKDGLQIYCRDCSRKQCRRNYRLKKRQYQKTIYRNRKRRREENRRGLLEYLRTHPCVDCPCSDIRILEFDHVRGKKKTEVTTLVASGYSWEIVMKEIKKCDIVCPNCHRLRTFRRQKAYRMGH